MTRDQAIVMLMATLMGCDLWHTTDDGYDVGDLPRPEDAAAILDALADAGVLALDEKQSGGNHAEGLHNG